MVSRSPGPSLLRAEIFSKPVYESNSLISRVEYTFVPGLFTGVLMAILVEWADRRTNWPAQVIAKIGLPSVGSVREQRHGEPDPEAFRAAKARINGILPCGSRGRSLLVISACSKDGKTMVVSNLARSLAEDGSTVMIVSTDVRSETSIDGTWPGNESQIGLSEFLNDSSIGLDDIIVATPEAAFRSLPAVKRRILSSSGLIPSAWTTCLLVSPSALTGPCSTGPPCWNLPMRRG